MATIKICASSSSNLVAKRWRLTLIQDGVTATVVVCQLAFSHTTATTIITPSPITGTTQKGEGSGSLPLSWDVFVIFKS